MVGVSGSIPQLATQIAQNFPHGYTDEMVNANMHRIIAAPNLLEALANLEPELLAAEFSFRGSLGAELWHSDDTPVQSKPRTE